ncbi:hypothetical protein C8Q72DRAFT_878814 [Fomitopsis betulina]|nr:hypothetical protein C8Q72DRAFT_878814 [Fomitopsis betulina]
MPFPVVYAPVLLVKEQDIYVLENLQDACDVACPELAMGLLSYQEYSAGPNSPEMLSTATQFVCPHCFQAFQRADVLRRHMKDVHGQ